jgi:GT2 family glycosyltransferase
MAKDSPLVSVVVPTLNRPRSFQRCLDSLLRQSYGNFEVIVVNGKGNVSLNSPRRCRIIVVRQNTPGHVHAYNLGVKHAKGKIVAFLDDDAVADENWIKELVKAYELSKNVGAVGGKVVDVGYKSETSVRHFHSRFMLSFLARVYETVVLENKSDAVGYVCKSGAVTSNLDADGSVKEVDSVQGVNMSFRKDVLMDAGLFDEGYRFHGNLFETDACLRVKRQGFRILYTPRAVVYHNSQKRRLQGIAFSEVRFFFKNFDWWNPSCLLRFLTKEGFWSFYRLSRYLKTKNKEDIKYSYELIQGFVKTLSTFVTKPKVELT